MRHLVDQHEVRVDPGAAVLQLLGHPHGACRRPGSRRWRPGRSSESLAQADDLLRIGEARHRHHRAEHFALHDLVVLPGARHHRGLVEEAVAGAHLAAGGDLDVAGHLRALDEARHAVALAVGDQRAELHAFLVLRAELDARTRPRSGRPPACRGSSGRRRCGRRPCNPGRRCSSRRCACPPPRLEVGVVEDDHRRLAAQLQVRALERAGGGLQHLAAGGDVAGERDHAHLRMLDQRLRPRCSPRPQTTLSTPFGQDVGRESREQQRRQRRLLAGLEHHGVAGGQRRRESSTPPSSAGSSRARWRRPRPPGRGGSCWCSPARYSPATAPRHAARRAREEAEAVGDGRDLVAQRARIGLAAVAATRARANARRRCSIASASLSSRRERSPGVVCDQPAKARCAAATARLHLVGRGLGDLAQHLAGGRD